MMKLVDIKFTKANLDRHLNHDQYVIVTTRGDPKGRYGDITVINGEIYTILNITDVPLSELQDPVTDYVWWQEGFTSHEEFVDEIERIYGRNPRKTMYIHLLSMVPKL